MRALLYVFFAVCLLPVTASAQAHLTDDRACLRHHGPADCIDGWTVCADNTSTHFRCWEHSLSDPTPSHRQAFVSRTDLMEMRMRMTPTRPTEDHEHQRGIDMLSSVRGALAECLPNRGDFGLVFGEDSRVFYRSTQDHYNDRRLSTKESVCLTRVVIAAMGEHRLRHTVLVWMHELPTASDAHMDDMVEDRQSAEDLRRMGL